MTGSDDPDRDMPELGEQKHRDAPVISDASLAALLAGAKPAGGSAPQLRPLAEALADLTARPGGDELDSEAATLAAFRDQFATPGPVNRPRQAHRRRRRRAPFLPRSLPVRAAAAVGAAVLSLGGLATAAYAGALPAPVQRLAHDIIGAPAPHSQPATRPSPARTTGLPTQGHGRPSGHPTAHGHSKPTPHGHGKPTPHGHGKPTSHPAPHGHGKPTSHPTPHGHGKPTPHGQGKPTSNPGHGQS